MGSNEEGSSDFSWLNSEIKSAPANGIQPLEDDLSEWGEFKSASVFPLSCLTYIKETFHESDVLGPSSG